MRLRFSKKTAKYLIYGGILLLLLMIQTSPYQFFDILNVSPELILPAVVLIGMYDGEKAGAIFALASGLIYDTSSRVIGLNTVQFVIFAFFAGVLVATQLKRNILSGVVLCVIAVFLQNLLTYLLFFGTTGVDNFLLAIKTIIFPKVIFTIFISAILYYVFLLIKMLLFEEEADDQYNLSSHSNDFF